MTIDDLEAHGANTAEGLARCMGSEELYLRLVGTALADDKFEALSDAIAAGDRDAAFEASHALKGVLANLSLTPLCDPVTDICELLRASKDADYDALVAKVMATRQELLAL